MISPLKHKPFVSVLALAVIAFLGGCEVLVGPRLAINRALDSMTEDGIVDDANDTLLELRFVSRTVDIQGDKATVFARGEVAGSLQSIQTECICVEAIQMERVEGNWRLKGSLLPRLLGVVETLDARLVAFNSGDVEAYTQLIADDYGGDDDPLELIQARLGAVLSRVDGSMEGYRQEIIRRTMRIERSQAIVTEDWRLTKDEDLDVTEITRGKARYVLVPTPDGWRFSSGLM